MDDRAEFLPLTQTIFSDRTVRPEIIGNCFATCVAAITGLPDVPNFSQEGQSKWFLAYWSWADDHGWESHSVREDKLPSGVLIATGDGPRGFKHAVLWAGGTDGMVVWDPHPSRAGLTKRPHSWIRLYRRVGGT